MSGSKKPGRPINSKNLSRYRNLPPARMLFPPLKERFSDDEIEFAIMDCKGVRNVVCQRLECTINQLDRWIDADEKRKEILKKAREAIVDEAEQVLMKNMRSKDADLAQRAAEFTLKSLGRDRGWNPQSGIGAVQINMDAEQKRLQITQMFQLDGGEQETLIVESEKGPPGGPLSAEEADFEIGFPGNPDFPVFPAEQKSP